MKRFFSHILCVFILVCACSLSFGQIQKYKCMLQMKNYSGEGAYVVVSLINPSGQYEKTLYVMGDDSQWYDSLRQWHKHQKKAKQKLNGITGASISGGKRSIKVFELDANKMNKGYKIRFESAVEHGSYHPVELELPLTTEGILQKTEGKGYIRFVKMTPA